MCDPNGVHWTPFFHGGEFVEGFSMARQMPAARSGSAASRSAVDSTCAAVTPKTLRTESRWRARATVSGRPIGNVRKAIMVRTNVESLISTKIGSRRQALARISGAMARSARRRLTGRSVRA